MENLTSKGILDLKAKIKELHKTFEVKPDSSTESNFKEVERAFDTDKLKDPNPIPDGDPSDSEFNFDIDFTEGEMSKLLPDESWFEKQLPDFKKLFDF